MQTHPLCLPCFRRQAEYTVRLATREPALQAAILKESELYLDGIDQSASPPVNAIGLYRLIARLAANPDPFAGLKRQGNDLGLSLRTRLQVVIEQGEDPLRQAILLAMAGNIIDYGAQQGFDLEETLRLSLEREPVIDDYAALRHDLARARTVLYLADNSGEIVFDGLVIERMPPTVEVVMAVKGGAIINDATMEDALFCGLDRRCRLITNGAICPGTPLELCSREFMELFATADVVISKGQGNFETLSEVERPVYHLLTVKCPVVADHAAERSGRPGRIAVGSAVLLRLPVLGKTSDAGAWPSPWPHR